MEIKTNQVEITLLIGINMKNTLPSTNQKISRKQKTSTKQ